MLELNVQTQTAGTMLGSGPAKQGASELGTREAQWQQFPGAEISHLTPSSLVLPKEKTRAVLLVVPSPVSSTGCRMPQGRDCSAAKLGLLRRLRCST